MDHGKGTLMLEVVLGPYIGVAVNEPVSLVFVMTRGRKLSVETSVDGKLIIVLEVHMISHPFQQKEVV